MDTAFEKAWQDVRAAYIEALQENGIIGSSLMLVSRGDILAAEYYGMADEASGRRVDARTIYHWASITKTFTGIALMQLRDRDRLDLDEPVTYYLPELRAVHNPFGRMEDITVRHLMSHAAGFQAASWPWGGDKPWHPHEPRRWEQLVAMMPYMEIAFEPGSRYVYSNLGIIFLGRIIEIISGDDYEVYVDKNILKPLGMYDSYFDNTPYHLLQHRSNSYCVQGGEVTANGLDIDTGITVSNGGLNAPLTDMAKYLSFLSGDGPDEAARSVLGRASLAEMWEAQHEVAQRGPLRESIGLIFHLMEGQDVRVIGHTGSQKGFISFFYVDPVSHTSCIGVYNTLGKDDRGPDTRALSYALRERLLLEVFPQC